MMAYSMGRELAAVRRWRRRSLMFSGACFVGYLLGALLPWS